MIENVRVNGDIAWENRWDRQRFALANGSCLSFEHAALGKTKPVPGFRVSDFSKMGSSDSFEIFRNVGLNGQKTIGKGLRTIGGRRGYSDNMCSLLKGKVSLVTGASRGIGAATATKLAALGSDLVVNFRSKSARAEEVAQGVRALGRKAIAIGADLTIEPEVEAMMAEVRRTFGRIDVLVLNASGGLEKGKTEDYAMSLNQVAQIRTAKLAAQLMTEGGRIVFVTSHWAHYYGQKPVMPSYEVVAKSKYAGEQALREYAPELTRAGISLVIISGDAIEGTITPRLLERMNRGLTEHLRDEARQLPTVDEFAAAIAQAAADKTLATGHTIFVGSTEY